MNYCYSTQDNATLRSTKFPAGTPAELLGERLIKSGFESYAFMSGSLRFLYLLNTET